MTEAHVPVDDLAAYAAGDLDATAAVAVEAHLVLCDECRADVSAVQNATAALAALPHVTMPAEVATRIDAALAAEPPATTAPANVLPMRRRRPTLAGLGAAAAGVALVAAIAVPTLRWHGGGKAADTAAFAPHDATTHRLTSNLDYTHRNLAGTLVQALAGRTAAALAGGVEQQPAAPPPGAKTVTPLPSAPAPVFQRSESDTVALQADPGRLAACVLALAGDQPAAARVPLLVDYARFNGRPAVVLVFPNVFRGAIRHTKVDVFVVGPDCGTTPGGDILDFARMDRPPGL